MQDGKRKSIVIGAKILMFLQSEGWNRVNSQEFTAALTAVLQSLQEHWRAEVGPAWAERGVCCEQSCLDSLKVSEALQSEVSAVQCLSCVSAWA